MARGGCANAYFRPQFVAKLQPADLHKLKIPSEFMMHMENEGNNCSVASVFSPLRKFWFIKLIKDDSRTYFKDNWCEFSKFHQLEVGFTLVFRYEGNMVLNVKVFGLNGCLKDYKQASAALLRRTGFNALIRGKSAEKRTKVTEGSSCSGKQKKRKHDMLMGGTRHKESSNVQNELRMASKSYVKKKNVGPQKKKNVICTSHETHETIMSHYNIHNFMPLPKKFGSVSPYILEKGEVTVKNEKQETWKVQFNTPARYNNLCRGWKEFCWQNNIKSGDTCLLKIIAQNEILVAISKAAKTEEEIVVE